jgi:hypothetical protein
LKSDKGDKKRRGRDNTTTKEEQTKKNASVPRRSGAEGDDNDQHDYTS